MAAPVKPHFDPVKANSPAASAPDEETPVLTVAELKQFRRVQPPRKAVPGTIRKRLRMSQAAFAALFGLSVRTIQEWEQGRRQPDGPARALLRVIEREPAAVRRALED